MRILVTGTSGHVGGAIARYLIRLGYDVAGVSRNPATHCAGLEEHLLDLSEPATTSKVLDVVPRCDAVVHCAAELSKDFFSTAIPVTNGLGTVHMLAVAREWKAEHFTFISGVNVIGTPRETPIREEHPALPETSYHASKLYGEHLTRLLGRTGIPSAVLRLSAPVGPHMPVNRILPVFIKRILANESIQLLGKGTRRQNYVDESDFSRAVMLSIERREQGVFNIGGAEAVSNAALAALCAETLGIPLAVEFVGRPDPEDDVDWTIDQTRAHDRLGYVPEVPLADTIRAIAAAQRS